MLETPRQSQRLARRTLTPGVSWLMAFALVLTACGGTDADEAATSTSAPADTSLPAETTVTTTAAPSTTSTTAAVAQVEEPPDWLSMLADYPRYLHHLRRINVATTNGSGEEITVTEIVLRTDHFAPLEPEEKSSRIPAEKLINLQVDFGEVVSCDDDGPLEAAVEIEMMTATDPTLHRYQLAIDPEPLDVIRDAECAQLAVTDAVDIAFSEEWTIDGETLLTDIVLDRKAGDEPVTVEALRGTEILIMQPVPPTEETVAVLEPGAASLPIPVKLEVLRCDPHAVGQSTKTYEFKLWVALGDGEAIFFTIGPDDRLRNELQGLIDACMEAEDS